MSSKSLAGHLIIKDEEEEWIENKIEEAEYPWRNEEILRFLYEEKRMSTTEIADRLDKGQRTIHKWLKRNGIEIRRRGRRRRPEYDVGLSRHEDGTLKIYSKEDNGKKLFASHQLVAIAYGADPYKIFSNGKYHVHHKNRMPWDNRPENLELIHCKKHRAITALQIASKEQRMEAIEEGINFTKLLDNEAADLEDVED